MRVPCPIVTTSTTREERLAELEQAIREEGYSRALQIRLSAKWGCSRRTVRNYKLYLVDEIKKSLAAGRDDMLAEFVHRLRVQQDRANAAGKQGAVGTMMGLEADVLGLKNPQGEIAPQDVRVEIHGLPDWGSAPTGSDDEG